ncbi:MAG TPA: peptidyl-prolyl cis-trans isomerase [Candidatus Eisenbacteria bacterium]|nr:peptidyl-prolyl cis-trans isomerase [Candidatus Eisenbacteria bacterium]
MTLQRHPIARRCALLLLALSALAPGPAASQEPPRAAAGADVIAVVDGIPIRQFEWDRLAPPYFKEVEAEAGRALSEEELRLLRHNVLHELIRERLWIADAKRRGLSVTLAQVEARMRQSDFFKTDGKPDEAKFQAFKRSPTSNYPTVRTQLELGMILEQYQRWMERRFGPRDPELRQAFRERTVQATLRYFLLGPEAVSLDPEATEAQIRAYYEAHPDEFRAAAEARIQFVKVPFPGAPAASDSARDVAAVAGLEKAKELLVAIRSGIPPETAAKVYGGFHDSGPFRIGEPIRGLGRSDALADAIRAGDVGAWLPDPIRIGTYHVVARVLEKKSSRRVPLAEAAAAAKRKADAEVREAFIDSLARAEIERHPESYLRPLATVTVVARPLAAYDDPKPISSKDVEKTLRRLRKQLGIADTARAWTDSVRTALPARLGAERRLAAGSKAMQEIMRDLEKGKSVAEAAGRRNATVSGVELYRGQPPAQPGLVEGALLDSLYERRPGTIVGPRVSRDTIFVARVERIDPAFRPPYETVAAEARTAALLARRQETEREAERWFRDRRDRYLTPVRFVLDAAYFPKQPLDTLAVPEDSVAAYHAAHPLEFTEVARARVRHILVAAAASDPVRVKDAARQKALDLRERIVQGAAFADVAKEHSDDKSSSERGGDLGMILRSQVVAEIGSVAFSIPVGQVSEPVLTRFGYHLIQVDERVPERPPAAGGRSRCPNP